jgi:hypothetical protein
MNYSKPIPTLPTLLDMPFSDYKNIGTVAKEYQIKYVEAACIVETEFPVNDYFRDELALNLRELVIDNSEAAICESQIYPVLREVWKLYRNKFILWSHQPLNYDPKLSGVPDYILAKRSPLGKIIFDKPYLVLVEAKKDNFEEGWGQCLAEMIAAQRINNEPNQTIYGMASNGGIWQFGKLTGDVFTKDINFYTIRELDKLLAAINYVFQQCELQLVDQN